MQQFILFYLIIHHFTVLYGTHVYLGCFTDRIGERDLNVFISDEMPFTVDQCLQACQIKGFLYAAIQYGNECRCGNQYGKYGQVSDDQCHYRCSNSVEKCGGNYRNSIYQVMSSKQTDVRCERNLIGYQGCYSRRTLPLIIGKVKTIDECVQMCAQNYLYAGIGNQDYCYCGEELNEVQSNSSLCHQPCLHSIHKECCGGDDVLSVYHVHYYQSEPSFNENSILNLRVKRADVVTGSTFVSMSQSTVAPLTNSNSIFTSMGTNQPSSLRTIMSTQFTSNPVYSSSSSFSSSSSVFSSLLTRVNTYSTVSVIDNFTSSSPSPSTTSSFLSSLASLTANASTVSSNITVTSAATVLNLNTTTTTTATTTTTPSSLFVISTIFLIYSNQSFDPNSNQSRESIRRGLNDVINLAFRCRSNISYPNCTQTRQTRQTCTSGYRVNLLTNIVQVSTGNPNKYSVDYSVVDLCNSEGLVAPSVLRSATAVLTRDQIATIFGYQFENEFIQSTALSASTTAPAVDQKLWLIGATIGPVVFVLLLIFIFCYLHYKCRPRQPLIPPAEKKIVSPPSPKKYAVKEVPPFVEKPRTEPDLRILSQRDPLVGQENPVMIVTKDSSRSSPRINSIDIPLDELRHQNQVERWRNKIRLQEKYQPSPVPELKPNVNPPTINILPAENVQWQPVSRLNELIYQETPYDPDSDVERRKRRRQRRRSASISDDPVHPIIPPTTSQPHIPIIAQVNERPDPNLIRLHYNPYEAGDRVQALSQFTPVPFTPKYVDEMPPPRYTRSEYQTSSPMSIDIADRAQTATNAYGMPKRPAKTRVETDREAMIREDEQRMNQRQHVFADEGVYVSTISKNYRDEYRIAKASVVNTKKLISNIHDDLQQIVQSDHDNYHA